MEKFSQRLEQRMADRSLNQSDLARAMGISQSTVNRWLNGSVPRNRTLNELCDLLRTHKKWLLEGAGPMEFEYTQESTTRHSLRFRDDPATYSAAANSDDQKDRNRVFLDTMPQDVLVMIAESLATDLQSSADPKKAAMLKEILTTLRKRTQAPDTP